MEEKTKVKRSTGLIRIDAALLTRLKVIAAERHLIMGEIAEDAIRTKIRELTELPLKS
jgi:hypothetical protein